MIHFLLGGPTNLFVMKSTPVIIDKYVVIIKCKLLHLSQIEL